MADTAKNVAIVGAGWAGLAAAVRAVQAGHRRVTLFEASRSLGGRARTIQVTLPNGQTLTLDNGQHVLLGAYRETLGLMQTVGVDLPAALTQLPVKLALLKTQPWSLWDYASLARTTLDWMLRGFSCAPDVTVRKLCLHASARVMQDVIEPLCVSALNTATSEASGRVFLLVLKDAFLGKGFVYSGGACKSGEYASSDMLIPKMNLGTLFPDTAGAWLQAKGAHLRLGQRVLELQPLQTEFDHVVIATPPWEAARLLRPLAPEWCADVDALTYRAIATVYAKAPDDFLLPRPMLALSCSAATSAQNPAQFVFAPSQAQGLLAFVVSDANSGLWGERSELERLVLAQGQARLGVTLQAVTTIVERRATFSCTAHIKRPAKLALAGLSVAGDYAEGPYPSTLEGAVMSGVRSIHGACIPL